MLAKVSNTPTTPQVSYILMAFLFPLFHNVRPAGLIVGSTRPLVCIWSYRPLTKIVRLPLKMERQKETGQDYLRVMKS